jgi:hypothetical protein
MKGISKYNPGEAYFYDQFQFPHPIFYHNQGTVIPRAELFDQHKGSLFYQPVYRGGS